MNNVPSDGFSEKLDATIGSPTGDVTTNGGSFTLLAPQGIDSTHLSVGLDTSSVGNKSGTATITLTSDGNGTSELGTSSLTSQTVTVTGSVYRLASASAHAPEPIAFGIVHVNDTAPSQALSLTNTAANDTFSEKLNASIGGATGGVTTNGGSFTQLAPQSVNNTALSVGISTASAGSKNGTAAITLKSDGTGTSGLGLTSLTGQTVNVTGQVNYYTDPVLTFNMGATITKIDATDYVLNFGDVVQNSGTVSALFNVQNLLHDPVFQDALGGSFDTSTVAHFSLSNFGAFSGLGPGATDSPGVSFNSNTAQGLYTDDLSLSPTSSNPSGSSALNVIHLELSITVVPEPASAFLLALGSSLVLARRRRRARSTK
jgi:hypothetical protein